MLSPNPRSSGSITPVAAPPETPDSPSANVAIAPPVQGPAAATTLPSGQIPATLALADQPTPQTDIPIP
ncbi:hypothetical protein Ancab_012305 [Ancistrocladus abbreviatus]